jgi:protein TonB
VTYAVGVSIPRLERPFPLALAMAALLHGLMALALWWAWTHRPLLPPDEEAIQVSFELPTAPQPLLARVIPARPAQPIRPEPLSKPSFAPPPPLPWQAEPAPQLQPPASQPALPKPSEFTAPPTVAPAPIPTPTLQSLLDPLLSPPPPAPPKREPDSRPASPAIVQPPPAAAAEEAPPPNPVANPGDAFSRARATDSYLWQIVRKLEGYSYQANVAANRGVTVVRVVIARDGKLLNVSIAKSSGIPEFDRGVLAGVRAGAPYTPLPPDIRGESASFDLPLVSVAGR